MNLLLSPHNDDAELFASFTILREHPLVLIVTDGFIQGNRGDHITWEQRRRESIEASKILGHGLVFGGLRDDTLTEDDVKRILRRYHGFEKVYAPAIQGGNLQHDMVGRAAKEVFTNVIQYTTYTKTELWTKGTTEVVPTPEENAKKVDALACYQSQVQLPATRPHFLAVLDKSEWLIP